MRRHVHLDPLGGVAGDMFAAALLDAWPSLFDGLVEDLRAAGLARDVQVRHERVSDEILAGSRFVVDDPREHGAVRPPHHAILASAHGKHAAHVPFADVRAQIARSQLAPAIIARAQDIFLHLARAEAQVHGFADVDAVVFHEVGAQDSIADVVTAAILIERSGAASWSCGPLPLGGGSVSTAHGLLPIPTPATRVLLEGFVVVDDGRPGERVTPTGAAILRHLFAAQLASSPPSVARRPSGALGASGTGWGSKRFAGLPNVLRALAIDVDVDTDIARDVVCALSFEIDDQSGEELAVGLDKIRAQDGVVDVIQAPVFGKKGRMASSVRVLCRVDAEDRAVRACLLETTTLGVRIERMERAVLARTHGTVAGVRIKSAARPDGSSTSKAEIDDVACVDTAHARAQKKRAAEAAAKDTPS